VKETGITLLHQRSGGMHYSLLLNNKKLSQRFKLQAPLAIWQKIPL